MKHLCVAVLLTALACSGIGCSKKKSAAANVKTAGTNNAKGAKDPTNNTAAPKPEVQAPTEVKENYWGEDALLVIAKSAIEKEHLLRAQMVDQLPTNLFGGLKSRIVAFRQKGKELFLMEAVQGHTVSPDLPQNLILTSFPIVEENDASVKVDFNAGMKKIFYASDWDFGEGSGTVSTHHVNITNSYVDSIETTSGNNLLIRQIANYAMPGQQGTTLERTEIRYYLSPYQPDPSYQPIETTSDDNKMYKYGFFTVTPVYDSADNLKTYAARFHPDKPVTFSVSPNTPPEFKQAVKDGILYWNTAFGKEIIQAQDAPEGLSGPHPEHNMIQWLDWDSAGFARADAQSDPRTGQVLNAQVMMTSVFGISGRKRAIRLLQQQQVALSKEEKAALAALPKQIAQQLEDTESSSQATQAKKYHLQLKGFESSVHCNHPMDLQLSKAGDQVLAALAQNDQDTALRLAQDYVREVVAHEVGHVLGLRHNFAGSLAAEYELSQRDQMVKEYLEGKVPTFITSGSVMEYQRFEESGITGAQMVALKQALPYDRHVIRKLYQGIEFPEDNVKENKERFLFCTDGHVGQYLDCERFDLGQSPFESAAYELRAAIQKLRYDIIYQFIEAKAPSDSDTPKALSDVVISAKNLAKSLVSTMAPALNSLKEDAKLIRFFRRYKASHIEINESAVRAEQFEYLDAEVKKYGGLAAIFNVLADDFHKAEVERITGLVDKYAQGTAPNGKTYEFNGEDQEYLKKFLGTLYANIEVYAHLYQLLNYATPMDFRDDTKTTQLATNLQEHLLQAVAPYITTVAPEAKDLGALDVEVKNGQTLKVNVKLPQFALPVVFRMFASLSFRPERTQSGWGEREKFQLVKKMRQLEKEAFGGLDTDQVELGSLPKEVIEWILEYRDIRKVLDPEHEKNTNQPAAASFTSLALQRSN